MVLALIERSKRRYALKATIAEGQFIMHKIKTIIIN
jgi:hypothetical protein